MTTRKWESMSGRVLEMISDIQLVSGSIGEACPAYFETQLAQVQPDAGSEASHDHAKIPISVEDHHILPVLRVFADIDVDLDVYTTRLSRDRYRLSRQRGDHIRQAQCKVVGASSIRLATGYTGACFERTFNFVVSNGRLRTGDDEVYISMILLLRCFVGNADVLEKGCQTWQKVGLE